MLSTSFAAVHHAAPLRIGTPCAMMPMPEIASVAPFILAPLLFLLCEYATRSTTVGAANGRLDKIYVRPGVGSYGVGLITIRDVPKGAVICACAALATDYPAWRFNLLPPSVRETVLTLYDGFDPEQNTYQIPQNYDQCIPLVSFINHSDEPNCVYNENTNQIEAARRLRTGEECTVDYLKYQEPGSYTYRDCETGFRGKPFFV